MFDSEFWWIDLPKEINEFKKNFMDKREQLTERLLKDIGLHQD